MRYSRQRELIHQLIVDSKSHPTASWVYEKARETIHNISLGTVYRNLKQLESEGLIDVIIEENMTRYDGNITPHHHLRCKVCGKLSDIEIPDLEMRQSIKQSHHFDVEKIEMVFTGTCSEHLNT